MGLPSAPFLDATASLPPAPFLNKDASDTNTPLNTISTAIEGSPIGKALNAVGSTSAMQPLGIEDVLPTLATADPVQDALNTAKQILEFPARLSQNVGELSGPVSEIAATHLGAMGLEPHISAALAMAAGMAVDPRNYVIGSQENLKGSDIKIAGSGNKATLDRLAQAEKYGVELSPAEATQSKMLNIMEDLGNIYPYTGDDFQNFYRTRLEAADNIRARLLDSVGNNAATKQVSEMMKGSIDDYLQDATPEQSAYLQDRMGDLETYLKKPAAGKFTQSMLAQQRKVALDAAGAQFDVLRSIVPDETPIKTDSFATKAKEFMDQEMQGKVSDRNPAWVKRLADYAGVDTSGLPTMSDGTPLAGPLYDAIQTALEKEGEATKNIMPYGATQMTMRKLRDLRISNDPGYLLGIKGQGNTYAGYAAELRGALHDDIDAGLNTLSNQAKKALQEQPPSDPAIAGHLEQMTKVSDMYQAAKENYTQVKELMNDPFIIKLLKNNPEDFLNHAVKAQDITNIGKLKDILGPDNFVPVQQNLLANMLVDKTGELNPKSFVNKVDKIGFPTLTQVFDPQTMYEIGQAQEVFSNMKRGFAEGSQTGGRLMAKAALFGVPAQAFHLVMAGEPLSAIGVLAGAIGLPKALAKMYLSEAGREMLIKGITVPQSAATALSLLGKGAMMSGLENTKASAQPMAMPGQMPGMPAQTGNQ